MCNVRWHYVRARAYDASHTPEASLTTAYPTAASDEAHYCGTYLYHVFGRGPRPNDHLV